MSAPIRDRAADEVCAAAVDLAREAAIETAGDPELVGETLGVSAEGERMVMHRFACRMPAYVGWYWAVLVVRAPRSRVATVNEVVLLPGEQALLAPEWVPWSQRLRPGDLGVGDLLPTAADDPRLALRASDVDERSDEDLFLELGLGRPRVLSDEGRTAAAVRWYSGEAGPSAPIARAAPARCGGCGFFVRLVGALGRLFGVCANELAQDDGRVVAVDHGCGGHSEALVVPSPHPQPLVFEDESVEPLPVRHPPGSVEQAEARLEGERVGADSGDGEPYGHS